VHKQITELETVGNIRLEEGKGGENWYGSCLEIVKSGFRIGDMSGFGVTDIKVSRIMRIHNRFLRNNFEEKIESLLDIYNVNYKKQLEYLFYAPDPAAPQETQRILEEGFRTSAENRTGTANGAAGHPALVNSLLAAETPRLMKLIREREDGKKFSQLFLRRKFGERLMLFPSGCVFICKILIIKGTLDPEHPNFDAVLTPAENLERHPLSQSLGADVF